MIINDKTSIIIGNCIENHDCSVVVIIIGFFLINTSDALHCIQIFDEKQKKNG